MHLINYYDLGRGKVLAQALAGQHYLHRLGRRDQQIRGLERLLPPITLAGVAVTN